MFKTVTTVHSMQMGFSGLWSSMVLRLSLMTLVSHGAEMTSSFSYGITDIGPVMLSDWYHEDYFKIVEGVVGTDVTLVVCPITRPRWFFITDSSGPNI